MDQADGSFNTYWKDTTTSSTQLSATQQALAATLNPRIPSSVREQALQHLESLKSQPDAPQIGFNLADDWKENDAVRYYGLQLLSHAVRYRWHDFSSEQQAQIRTWTGCLAGSLRQEDASFIRNKMAQLWGEVAKRCWGEDWVDMDKLLVTLWDRPVAQKGASAKLFVLSVLEGLCEDVMVGEDVLGGLRVAALGPCLNEIMVPPGFLAMQKHQQVDGHMNHHFVSPELVRDGIRCDGPGWLARMCDLLSTCVKHARAGGDIETVKAMSFCTIKTLGALRTTVHWLNLKAAEEVNTIDCLMLCFHTENVELQVAATEVLNVLLGRPYGPHWHDSWLFQMRRMMGQESVSLLRQAFERAQVSPGGDEQRYTLQKKLSEVLSLVGDAIAQHPDLIKQDAVDPSAFFDLLLVVLQHNSLLVSIPVLHTWTKLMAAQDSTIVEVVIKALGVLIQTCSARLLRYEELPEDSDNEIVQFLYDDWETIPERHAFLGNYRRYCIIVIQNIARTRPSEALSHVLGQMREMLEQGPYTFGRGFDSATYSKTSLPTLQFEAQAQVVSHSLKGYALWQADVSTLTPEDEMYARAENDRANNSQALQQWSYDVINTHSDNPEVAAEVLQTLVNILKTIKPESAFVLHIVQHLLTMRLYDNPAHTTFSGTVKAFEAMRVIELQKLAITFANDLLEVYNELEPRVNVLLEKNSDDLRLVSYYKAFLFMIVHRAAGINYEARLARLQQMLKPVYDAWHDQAFCASLVDLQSFCDSLGLGGLDAFYKAYRFDQISDWSTQRLDEAGQARQASIKNKCEELPLRVTKALLAATTEKLKPSTEEFDIACVLWRDMIPAILPNLLQMLRHAQAFHNMANWSHLPAEVQMVMKRTMQDRFWQSGISNESKDEFYARISGSKDSYEGFASAVRGTTRNIREQGYHLIYIMTKFEEQFYGIPDIAEPLANALFADTESLAANHLHPLINLVTGLVQRCPPHHRSSFLPPLLWKMFTKMDEKISREWDALSQADQQVAEDDALGDEMRTESVLRQLTYSMVQFVPFLLDHDNPAARRPSSGTASNDAAQKPLTREVVLANPLVLESMMLFCTHALRMRDTRCCTTVCRTFRTLIPLFPGDDVPAPQVREFISTEVLKACITSLNEPYFADMQRDLAALIGQILSTYLPKTNTPREVLLSLPNMSDHRVDTTLGKICKEPPPSERTVRTLVLSLLEGVRGVSIHEAGRIAATKKPKKSALQQKYMRPEQPSQMTNGGEVGLESVADLFGAT